MAKSLPWIQTPLIESAVLSKAAGCKILMKLEITQPGRSFKSRGVGNYMLARVQERADESSELHFYISSGGNAGLAAVRAAIALGHSCTVVVPLSTKRRMIDIIEIAGASSVIQRGDTWREADTYLREELLDKDQYGVYVPPFDHPDVWTGNATLVEEIAATWKPSDTAQRPKPAAIICSVGGGGLFCGVMQGMHKAGWANVPVLAVETDGANSLNAALVAQELVTLPGITSQAKSLGATRVAEQAFTYACDYANVKSVVLTDSEAAMGCVRLADEERLMVELSCGVNVAMCYDGRLEKALGRALGPDEEVIVVVCGGSDVDIVQLMQWRNECGP